MLINQSSDRFDLLTEPSIHPSTLALSWPRYHYEEKVGVYDAVEQVLVVQQLAINMFAFIFLVLLSGPLENNHILVVFDIHIANLKWSSGSFLEASKFRIQIF
jgi:hypothetical protein